MADGEKKTPRELMLEEARKLGLDDDQLSKIEYAYDKGHAAAGDTKLEDGEDGLTDDRRKLRGWGTDTPPTEDAESPYRRAEKRYDRARQNRAKREVARREYIDEIFKAATDGDERVLVKDVPPPIVTRDHAPAGRRRDES